MSDAPVIFVSAVSVEKIRRTSAVVVSDEGRGIAGIWSESEYSVFIFAGTIAIRESESIVAEGCKSAPKALSYDEKGFAGGGAYEWPTTNNVKPVVKVEVKKGQWFCFSS